jgi:uncharacterized protein YbbK (DUF523 family)
MSDLKQLFARLHGDDEEEARKAARELAGHTPIVVSACLLGERVRYDGGDKRDPRVEAAVAGRTVLPLCPEVLGGMGCPRPPVHFESGDGEALLEGFGRAVDDKGLEASGGLLKGARRADELARLAGAREAILKERSPSCGLHAIHTAGGVREGKGCFAAQLVRRGVRAHNEDGE